MAKKIAIVGGGISGLVAGVYAAKAGFDAEIYEKNVVVGGECTGWDREGFHIDNCIHWMMGTSPGTDLNRIWNEIGAIGPDTEILKADRMYTSELDGQRVTLWRDMERTKRELLSLSPEDRDEIERLMTLCGIATRVTIPARKPPELMGMMDGARMAATMGPALRLFREFDGLDTQDLMDRFRHPLIRRALSDFCTKESPGSSFPLAYGNFVGGDGGIPRGGSRAMALRVQRTFEGLGGSTFVQAEVSKVEREGNRALGLVLADGRRAPADYIICSCDPSHTFGKLLDPSCMDDVFREVYSNRGAYPVYGMFQAAYAVDSGEDLLAGDVILPCRDLSGFEWMSDRMTAKTYSYEPAFAPAGKQIVQILIGLTESAYDYWAGLRKDAEAYRDVKRELALKAMRKLEERFPGYEGKMRLLAAWTPITYERYCNAFKGYNQAYTITKRSRKNPYPSAYVKGIDNVLLAGQWLSPPGGLPGAAIQGKYAIQRILKREGRRIDF